MRKIGLLLVLLLCFLYISTPVSAHSGGTDSKGGHYNRSTGEYHYHHGYSEHQHRDMDGDGIMDCPYDFNDKTAHDKPPKQTINIKPYKMPELTEPTFSEDYLRIIESDTKKVDHISGLDFLIPLILLCGYGFIMTCIKDTYTKFTVCFIYMVFIGIIALLFIS